jgi:hypothetical protein
MMGININDSTTPYTAMICDGTKTVETRRTRSLDSVIGKRVGIIRTGVGRATLVAYATVREPVWYGIRREFAGDYARHRVPPGSQHDCTNGGKWGYPLEHVEPVAPTVITSRGIVLRRID